MSSRNYPEVYFDYQRPLGMELLKALLKWNSESSVRSRTFAVSYSSFIAKPWCLVSDSRVSEISVPFESQLLQSNILRSNLFLD